MTLRIDSTACFAGKLGAAGLSEPAFAQALTALAPAVARLSAAKDSGALPVLRLPESEDDLDAVEDLAASLAERCDDILVLGTGGSSLGGQAIYALADRGFGPPDGRPRLHFLDNIDPDSFAALFERVDLHRLGVVAISKSGATAETLCQTLVVLDRLRGVVDESRLAGQVMVITEPKASPLRDLAERFRLPCLDHHPGVGGRFSVLSGVGLLPAALAGLDIRALRAGAAEVVAGTLQPRSLADAALAVGAAVAVGLARERQLSQTVLMPYIDRLACFGLWFRQLWAESLGKQGKGTTPIRAVGTVDQHSQLQLYLDGPADKLFTLIRLDQVATGDAVPGDLADDPALAYLAGRGMGELLDAEARATAETLIRRGRPTRVIALPRLDEAVLGALLMHFMLETMLAAELLGVDAFDQPAVEEGKRLAREYLAASAATAA